MSHIDIFFLYLKSASKIQSFNLFEYFLKIFLGNGTKHNFPHCFLSIELLAAARKALS